MRARLGTTAHLCKKVVGHRSTAEGESGPLRAVWSRRGHQRSSQRGGFGTVAAWTRRPGRGKGPGFRIHGLNFGIQGLGVRVQGSGFRVQGSGFRVQGSGFRGSGLGVRGSGFRVWGLGSQVVTFSNNAAPMSSRLARLITWRPYSI